MGGKLTLRMSLFQSMSDVKTCAEEQGVIKTMMNRNPSMGIAWRRSRVE